jgi:hypothetical protein
MKYFSMEFTSFAKREGRWNRAVQHPEAWWNSE